MTYIIAEPCIDIKDKSCVDVCPVDCIHEFERILIIDPEECIDCGACEPECPSRRSTPRMHCQTSGGHDGNGCFYGVKGVVVSRR